MANRPRTDAGRYDRDRDRRLRLSRDVPRIIGTLTDVTEAVEIVGIDQPPPPQDHRCVVCGGMDCACPQPGGTGRTAPGVSDPTLRSWIAVEHAIGRARTRYAELVRDVVLVGDQVGLDLEGDLEPVAALLDPTCPVCDLSEDDPDCDHQPPGRIAWGRRDQHGRDTLVVAFRHAQDALVAAVNDIQDRWMLLLDDDTIDETTLGWSQKAVHKLAVAAQKLLATLTAVDHPRAGQRPPTCECQGDNCQHGPGDCEALTSGRCAACRQRDSRAKKAREEQEEGAA